jgi:hypothetical protein
MKIPYEKSKNWETDQFQAAITEQITHQPYVINYTLYCNDTKTTYQNLQIDHSTNLYLDMDPDVIFFEIIYIQFHMKISYEKSKN